MIYKFKESKVEELRKLLPIPTPEGITISCHKDADGVTAGVFSSYKYKIKKVNFPRTFGEVGDEDIMFDMSPATDTDKLVIDHHPPKLELPNAKLILGSSEEPASLLSFYLFKDVIPKKYWWKLIVGLGGDGHPERLPDEVWDESFLLLDDIGSFVNSKGKDYYFPNPVWLMLSSCINAFCRTNWPQKAFDLLKEAETPSEILQNPLVKELKGKIYAETTRIFKENKPLDLGKALFWKVTSPYNLNGILAIRLYEIRKKTAIVLNTGNNSISIRGVLAHYLSGKLKGLIDSGGHYGFVGGHLKPDVSIEQLKEAVRSI